MAPEENENTEQSQSAGDEAKFEVPENTDQMTLQEIIARQRAELVGETPDQASDEKPQSPEPSAPAEEASVASEEEAASDAPVNTDRMELLEIVARQRAELAGETPEQAADDKPGSFESSVPTEEAPVETVVEKEVPVASEEETADDAPVNTDQMTLQEIIALQRAKLKAQSQEPKDSGASDAPVAQAAVAEEQTPISRPSPAEAKDGGQATAKIPTKADKAPKQKVPVGVQTVSRRWRLMPFMLAANTVLIVVVTVVVLSSDKTPATSDASMQQTMSLHATPIGPEAIATGADLSTEAYFDVRIRREAERAFADGKYRTALQKYENMLRQAHVSPSAARLRDFLGLRMAECMVKLGQTNMARQSLREPSRSSCPIVRSIANRDLAILDGREGQYLAARRRAYVAMGVLGFMDDTYGVEVDCDYLVARALTEEMLAFAGQKLDISWDDVGGADPFTGKTTLLLRRTLADGVGPLSRSALNPSIRLLPDAEIGKQWAGNFSDMVLEDVLSRMSAKSQIGVRWVSVDPRLQRRVVPVLAGNGVSLQKLTEIACGSAGLLARFTGEEVLVHNPRWSDSMKLRRDLIVKEAISVWRRFFLRAPKDPRAATGHYAMGRLYESAGEPIEAMRVYKLVARRYWRSKVGASSLLRSASIRIDQLKDYTGAERDLLELLDRYPETELFGQVYLKLGQARREGGMIDKAARTFERLYHFDGLAASYRRRACLEAGKCFYQQKRYSTAARWVTRYLGLSGGSTEQLSDAYMLLGDSAAGAGNLDEASLAYRRVLTENPTNTQRAEALLALVPVQINRKKFVHVVGTLQHLEREKLTSDQFGRFLILASEAYRQMGLPRKAITLLRNHSPSVEDAQIRTRLRMELARCQSQLGRYAEARTSLTEVLAASGASPMYEAQCELAEISLKMGEMNEAIAAASQLMSSSCPRDIRARASKVMGSAYVQVGQYERAAAALAGLAKSKLRGKDNE